MTKICRKCNQEKSKNDFYKDKTKKSGTHSYCKTCCNKRSMEFKRSNKEKTLAYEKTYRERNPNKHKIYYEDNKEKLKKYAIEYKKANAEKYKQYRLENKEEIKLYNKNYRQQNRKKVNKQKTIRYKKDYLYKITSLLRSRIKSAIKANARRGSGVQDLGCTIEEFKIFIENQFQSGMTWENWSYRGWHLDHIVPLCHFDLTSREEFLKACNYTNLRPLWSEEHRKKSCTERRKL